MNSNIANDFCLLNPYFGSPLLPGADLSENSRGLGRLKTSRRCKVQNTRSKPIKINFITPRIVEDENDLSEKCPSLIQSAIPFLCEPESRNPVILKIPNSSEHHRNTKQPKRAAKEYLLADSQLFRDILLKGNDEKFKRLIA